MQDFEKTNIEYVTKLESRLLYAEAESLANKNLAKKWTPVVEYKVLPNNKDVEIKVTFNSVTKTLIVPLVNFKASTEDNLKADLTEYFAANLFNEEFRPIFSQMVTTLKNAKVDHKW